MKTGFLGSFSVCDRFEPWLVTPYEATELILSWLFMDELSEPYDASLF